jgi:hypothetical protein
MAINALRAHMAEFGVIAPQGAAHVEWLVCVSAWKSDPVFGVIGVQN